MLTIAKLFGKSPFAPLQTHLEKVACAVELLPSLFQAMEKQDQKKIAEIALNISQKEHEADITKTDIRNHLPRSLFLPIDKKTFLEILSMQDSFADTAEDIAVLATMRLLDNYEFLKDNFTILYQKNIAAFELAKAMIQEFDNLIESSFGGAEAEKVKEIIDQLAVIEYELDLIGYNLLKQLYNSSEKTHYLTFHLWESLIKEVNNFSNIGERLGNKIRMILELK